MRLIKLAMLALFGYVVYEFFRGMLHDTPLGNRMSDAWDRLAEEEGAGRSSQRAFGGGTNMTGPGEGATQSTLDNDGGSVRHKVGRGVVS
jgi:hypothetical protein